jgi:hypothetical protein
MALASSASRGQRELTDKRWTLIIHLKEIPRERPEDVHGFREATVFGEITSLDRGHVR